MGKGRGPWANASDIRFRKAMYRTIKRKQFIDLIYAGKAVAPTGILAAGQIKDYLLDAKETEEFFKNDLAGGQAADLGHRLGHQQRDRHHLPAGRQRQPAVGRDHQAADGRSWPEDPIEIGNAGEFLPRSNRGEYDIFTGTHPGYDSPQAPMRQNHSDSRLAFGGTALGEPDIDRMIEKAEQTPDFKENVKLVKALQLELLKRYTPYYNILTRSRASCSTRRSRRSRSRQRTRRCTRRRPGSRRLRMPTHEYTSVRFRDHKPVRPQRIDLVGAGRRTSSSPTQPSLRAAR